MGLFFEDRGVQTIRAISQTQSSEDKVHKIKLECGSVIGITRRVANLCLELHDLKAPDTMHEYLELADTLSFLEFYVTMLENQQKAS